MSAYAIFRCRVASSFVSRKSRKLGSRLKHLINKYVLAGC